MRRLTLCLVSLLVVLICSLTAVTSYAESPTPPGKVPVISPVNVIVDYNSNISISLPSECITHAFNGSQWLPTAHNARVFNTKRGIRLKLLKGERVMWAKVTYGNPKLGPVVSIPWGGKGAQSYNLSNTLPSGEQFNLALSEVTLYILQPNRPTTSESAY